MTNPNQPSNPQRALQARPAAPVTQPAPDPRGMVAPFNMDEIPPNIKALAVRIAGQALAKGKTITVAQAITAAYHFAETGEVLGRHAYVGTDGSVAGQVIEGYRGVARKLDMSKYQWRYRPPTDDEKAYHNIKEGDRMVVCELVQLAARAEAIRQGLEYWPVIGISIVRKDAKVNSPAYRDSRWIMEKQARVDALRQVGENTSAEDVLEEAEANGFDVSGIREAQEAGGWLNQEQAETAVDKAVARAARTPEDEAAEQAQLAFVDLKNKFGQWAYDCAVAGDNTPCPACGTPYEIGGHLRDCAFRLVNPNLPLYQPQDTEPAPLPADLAVLEPIRQKLRQDAASSQKPANATQREWTATTLKLLSEDPGERNAFIEWAFGPEEEGTRVLTEGEARAIYAWAMPVKQSNGTFKLTGPAVTEFQQIMAALLAPPTSETPFVEDTPPA